MEGPLQEEKVKVQFEFEPPEDIAVSAVEGVGVAYCYGEDGEEMVLYGHYGDPSSLAAIGLYTVGLREAERVFDEGDET